MLELDLEPFNAGFPRMTRPSSIGNGVQFLNRHLSSRLFRDAESLEPLVEFMRLHKYKGQVHLNPINWGYILCNLSKLHANHHANLEKRLIVAELVAE